MLFKVLAGLVAAAAVSVLAERFRALTPGGAVAATVVGSIVFAAGGPGWAAVLVLFFVSSSLLSRLRPATRPAEHDIGEKSDRRDSLQVLANGGVPAVFALLALSHPASIWLVGFSAAIASATADTWGTEVGVLSPSPPRRITTWMVVPRGSSGGITALGLVAALVGAAVIAVAARLAAGADWPSTIAVLGGGFGGSLLDSLLGASIQEVRRCPVCLAETEQRVHVRCGSTTRVARGITGIDNDVVNVLSCAGGSLAALAIVEAISLH